MIRSRSLYIFALEDSIEVYFVFYELHFAFYKFLKFIPIFWNIMKNRKSKNPPHSTGPASAHGSGTVGLAHGHFGLADLGTRRGVRVPGARGAVTARNSCARRHGGALAGGAVAANQQQGVAGEHQWGPGVAPGNVVVSGPHPESGSTMRGRKLVAHRRSKAVVESGSRRG
jgi:hypothetical protein